MKLPTKGLRMSKGMPMPKAPIKKKSKRPGVTTPEVNTMETPPSDDMADYARMVAAGGM